MTPTYTVAVVGAGALGGPMAFGLLATTKIGRLRIIDPDQVELSNLPRQPWFDDRDVGAFKALLLADRLRSLGGPKVQGQVFRLNTGNALDLLHDCDIVLDGTDNWDARYAIQAWSQATGKPWIFASALRWEGMSGYLSPERACLHCLFGEDIVQGPRCFESGVVGGVTLTVAGLAINIFDLWAASPTHPDLDLWWLADGWSGRQMSIRRNQKGCHHRGTG